MAKLLQRVDVTLRSFHIFNSRFSKADGEEHKKIVYYYPNDIEVNTKIKDVGLSEAIIAFTSTFTAESNDCKSLHTQKTTQVFFQPEADFWMVLVLNVPKEIRSKDGIEVAEYRGGEVHDRIYRATLEQSYDMFRLLNGTFQMNFEICDTSKDDNNIDAARLQLQQKLSTFYDKYLASLKLPACDIMDVTRSLQYLALDKFLFLNAHNFVNTIRATFSDISEAILLYKEQVVCGGNIHPLDLFCLHKHIMEEELLSKMPLAEVVGGTGTTVLSRSNSTITECYRNGAFITDFAQHSGDSASNAPSLPKLYLGRDASLVPYYLIVYRALDAVLCFFISADKSEPQQEFFDEMHSYIGMKLASISRDIGESLSNTKQGSNSTKSPLSSLVNSQSATLAASDTATPKYLFVNEQSLKHLSNICVDRKRPQLSTGNVPSSVLQLIADFDDQDSAIDAMSDCTSNSSFFNETLVKTTNDFWIVKRCCNWRKYYVIVFNNKSTLLDVTAEAMRIFEQELTDNVFFEK